MSSTLIAITVFLCVFGSALAGLFVRARLPGHHLKEDTKDIVKLAIGVIATMTALVLGLLVSSAKNSFDRTSDDLTRMAVRIIELDRTLANYGPEAADTRTAVLQTFSAGADAIFAHDRKRLAEFDSPESASRVEYLPRRLRVLAPRDDVQRELKAQAIALSNDLAHMRWTIILHNESSVSLTLLGVVVVWLALIFAGLGLFSPRNGTLVVALLLCALCVSGAIFLILEMDNPLTGIVRVSDAPMRAALAHLGRQ
ncbi:MAG: hypothetical protein ACREUW_15230 [Burkholderiales bacterium]